MKKLYVFPLAVLSFLRVLDVGSGVSEPSPSPSPQVVELTLSSDFSIAFSYFLSFVVFCFVMGSITWFFYFISRS